MVVYSVKCNKKETQEVLNILKTEENIDNDYKIIKDGEFVYLPIKTKKISKNLKEKIVPLKKEIKQKKKNHNFKDILKERNIPLEIINKINTAYDIVGDIIIIGLEDNLEKYYEDLGKALTNIHPNCKIVLRKTGQHHGVFRVQNMEHIFGEKRKETIIKENNCRIKTDVEKVFCSTRLSYERKRISKLIKDNQEKIGVFFAGVGPFALVIAKEKNAKEIIGIELNPVAIEYFKENLKINNVEDKIKVIQGDVKEVSKKYKDHFDRIIMPLPKSAETFLDSAIYSAANKCIIHIYGFVDKDKPYEKIKQIIDEKASKYKIDLKIINKKIVRSYSPSIVQIVVDIQVLK